MGTPYRSILDHIGNTPLVPLKRLSPSKHVRILAKLESFNPGGSVKDRPALRMIEDAEARGDLTPEKVILEATSGNTGIGLALVAAVKGYRILLTMSESVSEERVKILRALGADIHFTPAHLSTDGAIEYVYHLMREQPDRYWLADQFNNESNWKAHYDGTAVEIWRQTKGQVDAAVATMGTTGTLMGLARRLKQYNPAVRVVGVEPYMGHKIQGLKNMKESYQPGIFDKNALDDLIYIDDDEAFHTARMLAQQEGLFVGMSSGAAVAAALRLAREMPSGRIVVVLPDGGERYLSTALFMVKKKSGLKVYNTLQRRKEDFVPVDEHRVHMYSCGPTVCRFIDISEWRRFLVADLIRRFLEKKGYEVTHVMNITDLDDRTIEGAQEAGMSLQKFTVHYEKAFLEDLDHLGIKRATVFPRASEHVDEMIALTQRLLEKGFAYEKFRSIYFDIARLKKYGQLSRIDLQKIRIGKTVDLDQYEKEDPRDFTLLKRSTLSELKQGIFFKTQWGNVRPSWHLECSAMALKYLAAPYDIHTSGVNLIFPHHENAIAIGEALTGTPPANYWIHSEPVMINPDSAAEEHETRVPTLRDLLERGYTGREIRYWLLSRHYRKPIYFSWPKLEAARNTVAHLDQFVHKLHASQGGPPHPETDQLVYDLKRRFSEAMEDDLNVAPALAALFRFTHRVNRILDHRGFSPADKEKLLAALEHINAVLGILDLQPPEIGRDGLVLIERREAARRERNWEEADRLRRRLLEMGIEVLDTHRGPVWRIVSGARPKHAHREGA